MVTVSSPSPAHHRKSWSDAPSGFFEAEAAGLRWLAQAERHGGARVVEVCDVGTDHIELTRLRPARPTAEAAEALGRGLAVTHGAGATAFGSPPPGWTGDAWIGRSRRPTTRLRRGACSTRSSGCARSCAGARPRHLDDAGARTVDRVCDRLTSGDFDDDRPPARIHGDLWSGNVVFTSDGAVLIDPAAHGGHGLTDLAMLALFGCPGLDRVAAAYEEAAGLDAGWRDLIGLHQLHPLAVHASSHGPAYAVQLVEAARAFA